MCENRLIYALKEFNAALVTMHGNLPTFDARSVKTALPRSGTNGMNVKTFGEEGRSEMSNQNSGRSLLAELAKALEKCAECDPESAMFAHAPLAKYREHCAAEFGYCGECSQEAGLDEQGLCADCEREANGPLGVGT
jgi:hypothetical protein